MIVTHDGRHGPGCFGCKARSIRFGASAMPTRKPHVNDLVAKEAQWAKDHPAYKALRKDGLQPRTSEGAHELMMTATTRNEIEGLPKLYGDRDDILTGTVPSSVKADQ